MGGGETGWDTNSVCHRRCPTLHHSELVLCLSILSSNVFFSCIFTFTVCPRCPGSPLQCLFAEACVFVPIAIISYIFIRLFFFLVIFGVLFKWPYIFLICLFSNVDSTPLLALVDTSALVVSLESFQLFSALTSRLPSQSLLFSFRPFVLSFHLELPTSESSHFLLYFLKAQFSPVFPQSHVLQFATQTVV